jgi:alpha-tubulin suppressor-like RCC1 family protein
MKIDISTIGYRWKGIYSQYLAYAERDVVFKNGGAQVYRNGTFVPFALGQQDVVSPGAILTGGDEKFGIYGTVLHSNGASSVDFQFMGVRNGTVAVALAEPINSGGYVQSFYHTSVLMNNGSVRAWGYNESSRNGLGLIDQAFARPMTVAFPAGTPKIKSVKIGVGATYYIDANQCLWAAGSNVGGRQGTGSLNYVPKKVNGNGDLPLNAKVVKMVVGYDYFGGEMMACITTEGRVYIWGINDSGQLGLGDTTSRTLPTLLPLSVARPMKDVFLSAGGYGVGGFLTTAGKLYTCGGVRNGHGYSTSTPVLLEPWDDGATVKLLRISESDAHWVAGSQYYQRQLVVLDNGELWLWGDVGGQVSDIPILGVPTRVLTGVKDAYSWSGGYDRSIALMLDGTVKAVGYCGFAINGGDTNTTIWTTIGGSYLTGVTKIQAMGGTYGTTAMALRSDGKAVGWGYGVNGMLGKGDTADTTAAQAPNGFVLLDETIVDFAMSGTCEGGTLYAANHFLTSDGRVFSVGSGYYYQNGTYANVGTAVPRKIVF